MKIIKKLLLATSIFYLFACANGSNMGFQKPDPNKARVLVLGGEEFEEGEPWEIISWECRDFPGGDQTLVEVGRAFLPSHIVNTIEYQELTSEQRREVDIFITGIGFVLYDGTDIGDLTVYNRDGLSHRWDWEGERGSYSIIIKPDGTGLYYDFSTAENGLKQKADDVFECDR